jgi:uncharacterized protein (TIGR04222 family)
MNPYDLTATPFLELYIVLFLLAAIASSVLRLIEFSPPGLVNDANLDPVELAYLAGGRRRALDAVAVGLIDAGGAVLQTASRSLRPVDPAPLMARYLTPFRRAMPGAVDLARLGSVFRPGLDAVRDGLAARGLVFGEEDGRRAALLSSLPFCAMAAFGGARVVLGASRHHAVGYILGLTLLALFAAIVRALRPPVARRAGAQALRAYRAGGARLMRAPLESELVQAFALTGAAALAGTPLAAYARLSAQSGGAGGGGDGDGSVSSCGGGGDGGGGGGCGGCGGH